MQETSVVSNGDFKENSIYDVNSCLTFVAPKYNSYGCFHFVYAVNQNIDIQYESAIGAVPWEQPSVESEKVEKQQTYRRLEADE